LEQSSCARHPLDPENNSYVRIEALEDNKQVFGCERSLPARSTRRERLQSGSIRQVVALLRAQPGQAIIKIKQTITDNGVRGNRTELDSHFAGKRWEAADRMAGHRILGFYHNCITNFRL
jgi:hypothetical protein